MGRIQTSMVVRQFKRTFDEQSLNELGMAAGLCKRQRIATPYRLMLSLIQAFAGSTLDSIADILRTFNALCATQMRYKPFHNQLRKRGFAQFVRLMLSRLLNELACDVLQFSADSAFARFERIRIQDGTSFAVKPALAAIFPGRFTTISPAAVELHVDMDLMSETANRVMLSADSEAEGQFLPEPEELAGELLLADRGYVSIEYFKAVEQAGGSFIVRGKSNMNPLIIKAMGPDGKEIECLREKKLKQVRGKLLKNEWVDLRVRFGQGNKSYECRMVVHPNLSARGTLRYLLTNLDAAEFSAQQISDGYRLRWQIELLFKEWKSHCNLHAFDTANANIAEGLIWASLCAATLKRYCTHTTQRLTQVAMSTRRVAKCVHHVLTDVLRDLMHDHERLPRSVSRAIEYLAANASRAHPKRDCKSGRLKIGLIHAYVDS